MPIKANTVFTHKILNTHEPIITIKVGIAVLWIALEAAILQSIRADKNKDSAIIFTLLSPASITAASEENKDRNSLPKSSNRMPSIRPSAMDKRVLVK